MKPWLNPFRQLTRSEKFLPIINAGNLICSLANTVLALIDRQMPFGLGLFAIITAPPLTLAIHGSLLGKPYAYWLTFWLYLPQVLQIYTTAFFYYIQYKCPFPLHLH